MNFFDLRESVNGDQVIGFTSAKEWQMSKFVDSARLSTYFQEDDGKSHTKYLGLINLFATTEHIAVPTMQNLLKDAAVLEVEPGQSITYDLPVNRSSTECMTIEDTSEKFEKPGYDGTIFEIVLSREYAKGDILGYDLMYGEQIKVVEFMDAEIHGEGFKHYVTLWTKDRSKWFPSDKLKAGISYFKITNVLGEYDTNYSTINLMKGPAGTITCEYILGDPRGVETFVTAKAYNRKAKGLSQVTDEMRERAAKKLDMLGGKEGMFVISKMVNGGVSTKGSLVGGTLEYLMLSELAQMEAHSILFSKAGEERTNHGTKSVNEGLWHQMRRGKIIRYPKPGGLTFDHINEAASYVFRNSPMPLNKRRIKFKGGSMAEQNVMQLFREEVMLQAANMPGFVFGNDKTVKGDFLSGPLDGLRANSIVFKSVQVPGVGEIEFELDNSWDYQPFADRFSKGFYGSQGFPHQSYSMYIEDASNPMYSNVNTTVKGASLVEGGRQNANIYYVKPEGPNVVWGYEQGRMVDGTQATNITSSLKQMARSMWATSHSSVLMIDTTRSVTIELQFKG